MPHIRKRSISRILSRRNTEEKKVDSHVIDKLKKLFPGLFKDNMVDPARSAIMAAVTNIGTYAFGAYDEPTVDGFRDLTTEGSIVEDWVNNAMEGVLKITLKEAKNLRNADILWDGKSDPYVVFTAGGSCVKSETVQNDLNPVWNSTHYLFLRKRHLKPELDKDLKITCFDNDTHEGVGTILNLLDQDDSLGSASLPLDQLKEAGTQSFELNLKHPKHRRGKSTVSFTTEFITVEKALKELDKENETDTWIERRELSKSEHWKELTEMTEIGMLDAEKVAYIDAPSTGTQAWVHVNTVAKAVVVAFRGTEMNRLKDIIADANFFPSTLISKQRKKEKQVLKLSPQYLGKHIRVHSGFKNAYDSVRESILRIVYDLTGWNENWTVIITGHSLGGALATLCAFEFENLTFTEHHSHGKHSVFKSIRSNSPTDGKAPNFCMMNFGAPRVGNPAFVKAYNETVCESLRVINANDLIHFLPPILYRHTKYEVLLRTSGEVDINGIDFQSGHSRETRDQIENGEIDAADLVKRAFSGFSIVQHLGTHYFELVQAAAKKFFERLCEVREIHDTNTDEQTKESGMTSIVEGTTHTHQEQSTEVDLATSSTQ